MKEVDELAELDIEVIALDCTKQNATMVWKSEVHSSGEISNQLLMADTIIFEGASSCRSRSGFVRNPPSYLLQSKKK